MKKYYITKKAQNGITVFYANFNFLKNKKFSSSIDTAYFFRSQEDAQNVVDQLGYGEVVESEAARLLAIDNVNLAIQSHIYAL